MGSLHADAFVVHRGLVIATASIVGYSQCQKGVTAGTSNYDARDKVMRRGIKISRRVIFCLVLPLWASKARLRVRSVRHNQRGSTDVVLCLCNW